jgi:two-component sensor histidine kinase
MLAPQALQLEVADDGIGLPEDFDLSHSLSLGMRLVVGLANQLGAAVSFTNEPGCVCRLSIPLLRPVSSSPAHQSLTYA